MVRLLTLSDGFDEAVQVNNPRNNYEIHCNRSIVNCLPDSIAKQHQRHIVLGYVV